MTDQQGIEAAVERSHAAVAAIIKGDADPFLELFSHEDDATLANPWGPPVRGINDIRATVQRAAANYREGEVVDFERVGVLSTSQVAYMFEIERFRVKLPGQDEMTPVALRVTSIFRPEGDEWRLIHRHADPITTPRGPESLTR